MFNEAWGKWLRFQAPQTLPCHLLVVDLLQSDLELLVAKPSSPYRRQKTIFGPVLALFSLHCARNSLKREEPSNGNVRESW